LFFELFEARGCSVSPKYALDVDVVVDVVDGILEKAWHCQNLVIQSDSSHFDLFQTNAEYSVDRIQIHLLAIGALAPQRATVILTACYIYRLVLMVTAVFASVGCRLVSKRRICRRIEYIGIVGQVIVVVVMMTAALVVRCARIYRVVVVI